MPYLRIKWVRSAIGRYRGQRRIIEALGLKRLSDTVVHSDSPGIRGMVNKIPHLVEVEEMETNPLDIPGKK